MDDKITNTLSHIGIDCGVETKLLHNGDGRQTWLVSGDLPWGVADAVVKIVDEAFLNEIRFYEGNLLAEYRPEIYATDIDKRFVAMEYVKPCEKWNTRSLREAIDLMADLHVTHWRGDDIPTWIPVVDAVTMVRKEQFYIALESESAFFEPYAEILTKGAEMVVAEFPRIAKALQTVIHGDFMYVNMGVAKSGLILYDWSNIRLAPVTVDLCYALEHFTKVFGRDVIDVDSMIEYYVEQMECRDVHLDAVQFKTDYTLTHLYRCLFSFIPVIPAKEE